MLHMIHILVRFLQHHQYLLTLEYDNMRDVLSHLVTSGILNKLLCVNSTENDLLNNYNVFRFLSSVPVKLEKNSVGQLPR